MEKRYREAQHKELSIFLSSSKSFDEKKAITEFQKIGIEVANVNGSLLDIGGGYGHYASLFINAAERIVVDPLYDKFGITLDNIEGINASGENLPFPPEYFDFIIMRNVIDHMLSPHDLLKEASRVVKNSGKVYFMVNIFLPILKPFFPILNRLDKPHPIHFCISDLKELLRKSNFKIITEIISTSGDFKFNLKRITGRLIKKEYYAILQTQN